MTGLVRISGPLEAGGGGRTCMSAVSWKTRASSRAESFEAAVVTDVR